LDEKRWCWTAPSMRGRAQQLACGDGGGRYRSGAATAAAGFLRARRPARVQSGRSHGFDVGSGDPLRRARPNRTSDDAPSERVRGRSASRIHASACSNRHGASHAAVVEHCRPTGARRRHRRASRRAMANPQVADWTNSARVIPWSRPAGLRDHTSAETCATMQTARLVRGRRGEAEAGRARRRRRSGRLKACTGATGHWRVRAARRAPRPQTISVCGAVTRACGPATGARATSPAAPIRPAGPASVPAPIASRRSTPAGTPAPPSRRSGSRGRRP
jgi:hypothetical protein